MNAPTKLKTKKCKQCGDPFIQYNSIRPVCAKFECQVSYAEAHVKRSVAVRERQERVKTREAKDKLKTARELMPSTQDAFNKFIRLRDCDQPCISCGRLEVEYTLGGQWDCGHFQSVGAKPELRFEEKNAYRQCKKCNGGAGKHAKKNHTVSMEYEARLRLKIGDELVDWLKGPHEPKRYKPDDLRAIKKYYLQKCRELEKSP